MTSRVQCTRRCQSITCTTLNSRTQCYAILYIAVCGVLPNTHSYELTKAIAQVPCFCCLPFQGLHGDVERQRSEFDNLLQSCDLHDTPFDHTHFESDVTSLRDQMATCDKVHTYYN